MGDAISSSAIEHAAWLVSAADMMIFVAGAGMGVDSGLPDFRGEHGFWGAYPALGRQGLDFMSVASPRAFHEHPRVAWGFYGPPFIPLSPNALAALQSIAAVLRQ